MARLPSRRFTPLMGGLLALAVAASACGAPGSRPKASGAGPADTTGTPPSSVSVAPTTEATTTTVPPTTTTVPPTTAAPATATTGPPTTDADTPVSAAAACPENLASAIKNTGSARQLITVESSGYGTTVATLETWQRSSGNCWTPVSGPWQATIGENGFSNHHEEGDGTSPTGAFGIGPVIYGNAPNPGVKETYHQLVCGDWWDEDPRSPEYNTFQHVACGATPPFGGGSEALWTETQPYPSFAVIDYNTGTVVPYAGSALFLHADTGGPTDGCVAIPVTDLDRVLDWIDPSQDPTIVMGPSTEITAF